MSWSFATAPFVFLGKFQLRALYCLPQGWFAELCGIFYTSASSFACKILSWNFEQDSKLKLEDALFSQMSLDVFLNGRAMAKMSDWTMLIAKLNIANKFGQKNYSIKAFPSPELTEKEKEILFRCAEKAGYDPEKGFSISDNIDSH